MTECIYSIMHCGVSFYVRIYLRVFLDAFHYTLYFITPSWKGYFCGKNFNEFSYVYNFNKMHGFCL